jgi:hypothetical protein
MAQAFIAIFVPSSLNGVATAHRSNGKSGGGDALRLRKLQNGMEKRAAILRRFILVEPKGQPAYAPIFAKAAADRPPPRAPCRTMRGRAHARPDCIQPR